MAADLGSRRVVAIVGVLVAIAVVVALIVALGSDDDEPDSVGAVDPTSTTVPPLLSDPTTVAPVPSTATPPADGPASALRPSLPPEYALEVTDTESEILSTLADAGLTVEDAERWFVRTPATTVVVEVITYADGRADEWGDQLVQTFGSPGGGAIEEKEIGGSTVLVFDDHLGNPRLLWITPTHAMSFQGAGAGDAAAVDALATLIIPA